MADLFIDNFV